MLRLTSVPPLSSFSPDVLQSICRWSLWHHFCVSMTFCMHSCLSVPAATLFRPDLLYCSTDLFDLLNYFSFWALLAQLQSLDRDGFDHTTSLPALCSSLWSACRILWDADTLMLWDVLPNWFKLPLTSFSKGARMLITGATTGHILTFRGRVYPGAVLTSHQKASLMLNLLWKSFSFSLNDTRLKTYRPCQQNTVHILSLGIYCNVWN